MKKVTFYFSALVLLSALVCGTTVAQRAADVGRGHKVFRMGSLRAQTDRPPGFFSIYWPDDFNTSLEQIDTLTGQGTHVWNFQIPEDPDFPGEPLFITPFGVAFDVDGTIYTLITWLDFNPDHAWSRLARVDSLTGVATLIGEPYLVAFAGPEMDKCGNVYATGFTVGDPAGGPPLIYGDSYLYRIDKVTGESTRVGDTGRTDWMDLDFDSLGRLWATTENELYILDIDTGEARFVREIIGVPQDNIPGVCPEDWPYMEVMTIAFDNDDVLWATAMRGFSQCAYEDTNGPVMSIDVHTGVATVVGYTNLPYNHGGDIVPTKAPLCHIRGNGTVHEINVSLDAVPAHLNHGDILPSGVGSECGCPPPVDRGSPRLWKTRPR